jgi:hypothetical protein
MEDIKDKINAIHDAVVWLKAEHEASKKVCDLKHTQVDDRIHALHKVIKGNGAKGLEQLHHDLSDEFLRFKYYVMGYCAGGALIGGFVYEAVKKYWR